MNLDLRYLFRVARHWWWLLLLGPLIAGATAYASSSRQQDLYAAGVVLYECLTGHKPFEATSVMVLIKKLLTEMPQSPVELNPDVPPALAALMLRLLAKEPAERVQTARELEQQLQSLG